MDDIAFYRPGMPVIGPTWGVMRDPIGYHLEAYRRHGSIYWTSFFGEKTICLAGLEANEFIWSQSAIWDYGVSRKVFGDQFGAEYLTRLDGEKHKKKRRRMNPAFRPEFLMRSSSGMIRVLAENLAPQGGKKVELRHLCDRLIIRMTSVALLDLTLPVEIEDAILLVESDLVLAQILGPAGPYWLSRPAYLRAKKKVLMYLGELVDRWLREPGLHNDMFAAAIKTQPDEEPLSREELVGDLYLLLTGGLNSTSNLALWVLMYIYDRPDWLAQLREEVAAVPPSEFTAMKQWPRIKATVMEAERLRPGTPLSMLYSSQDFEFKGVTIRKGTLVTHFLVLPHYLPEIYKDPQSFTPERFLGETSYPPKAHGTFGSGIHICIGMPLARLQVPLILAAVLADYDLKFSRRPSFRARLGSALKPVERRLEVTISRRG